MPRAAPTRSMSAQTSVRRAGFQGDDARWRFQRVFHRRFDFGQADRAHVAAVLGDDMGGAGFAQQARVEIVEAERGGEQPAYVGVDGAALPGGIDARAGAGRHAGDRRRPVAFVGAEDDVVAKAQSRDDLGRARHQRGDPRAGHGFSVSGRPAATNTTCSAAAATAWFRRPA